MIYLVILGSVCCCITATIVIMRGLRDINRRITSLEAEIIALKSQRCAVSPHRKKKRVRIIAQKPRVIAPF